MMRNHDASPEKVLAARAKIRNEFDGLKKSTARDAGLNKWEEQGPGYAGGRIRAIAPHPTDPDIIYLGGVAGGIWKTTDGGATWDPLNDFLPSLSVTSIIINPTQPDIMFAATGEAITAGSQTAPNSFPGAGSTPGAGIFRSNDGGDTWSLLPSIDPSNLDKFYWVNTLEFDPSDYSAFYAGTSNRMINGGGFGGAVTGTAYRFSDNGSAFEELYTASLNGVVDIEVHPAEPDHIYFGHMLGAVEQLVVGGVKTYPQLDFAVGFPTNSRRVEFSFAHSNSNVVYAFNAGPSFSGGELWKTIDGGSNWSNKFLVDDVLITGTIMNPADLGGYAGALWVDPLDENNVVIGGLDLYRSIDGGSTFTQISDWEDNDNGTGTSAHADHHVIVEASDYSAANKEVYFGNDGGIAKASNYATVTETVGWDLLNGTSLGITQFYESDVYDTTFIGGAQDNGTSVSQDDADTWYNLFEGDGGGCAISHQNQRLAYFSSQSGNIRVTDPAYLSPLRDDPFVQLSPTYEDFSVFVCQMQTFPNDGTKLLIGSYKLFETEADATFHTMLTITDRSPKAVDYGDPITALDISSGGDTVVIGYYSGEVWLGRVLAPSWVWTQLVDYNKVITSIDIAPYNKKKIAVTLGGYIDDNVRITTDAGVTWNEKSNGIPALQINSIRWHPDATGFIYAGTDLGIFSSDDGGNNWNVTPNYNGVSDGPVFTEVSELQFSKGVTSASFHYLYATTFGRGIWRTENIVRANSYIDEDYIGAQQFGTQNKPFELIEQAIEREAHGQTWYFDAEINETDSRTNYPVPAGGAVLDKRIGVIKKFPGKEGPVVIGN